MSINHFTTHRIYKFEPILSVLSTRKYHFIMLVTAIIYALTYMFAVGIISYYPGFGALKVGAPVVNANSLGIMIVPFSYVFIFIFYYAIAFLVISSFLVGLNIALIVYSRKVTAKSCDISSKRRAITNINISSRGILGIIPAFFTSFACCGGGFLALVIGSTTFSSLALSSRYLAPLTIAALALSIWFTSRKIRFNSISYRREVLMINEKNR